MNKKQFKVVFRAKTNTYELWFINLEGEWVQSSIYSTFDLDGNVIEDKYSGTALINENILWEINKLVDLGYKFIGIEKA